MDYRRLYEETYGILLEPNGLEVHHIDHNRKNNDIKNLVALPTDLHHRYHRSFIAVAGDSFTLEYPQDGGIDKAKRIKDHASILEECAKWMVAKDNADMLIFHNQPMLASSSYYQSIRRMTNG